MLTDSNLRSKWQARPLWFGSLCHKAGGGDVKEIAPETSSCVDTGIRLPLAVKVFDRVLAAGTLALRFSKENLANALRVWLFSSMSLLHINRDRPHIYPDQHEALARTITADQEKCQKLA